MKPSAARRPGPAALLAAGLAAALLVRALVPGARLPAGPAQLVVYGEGFPAAASAVSGAEDGLRTLWLVPGRHLGGVVTEAWLTTWDLSRAPGGGLLTRGLFARWYTELGGHDSFSLRAARALLRRLAFSTPGLTTWLGAEVVGVRVRQGRVVALAVRRGRQRVLLHPQILIDASSNAALAGRSGARFSYGLEDAGLGPVTPAATLIFRLRGVDWAQVLAATRHIGLWRAELLAPFVRSAWGYAKVASGYRSATPRVQLRGLNLARTGSGDVLVSALWVFGVDPLSPASLARGRALALRALPGVVAYLRRHAAGFRRAELVGAAPELYVRQSHQLLADQTLTLADVLQNRTFADDAALGSYPVDVQAFRPGQRGYVLGTPVAYGIPFGSLVPRGLANVLVVGRSAGYTSLAEGSARTLPVGIAEGQAAAALADVAIRRHLSLPTALRRPSAWRAAQGLLRAQGVDLQPPPLPPPSALPPSVRRALTWFQSHLLLVGGYANRYHLSAQEPWAEWVAWLAAPALWRPGPVPHLPTLPDRGLVTRAQAARTLLALLPPQAPSRLRRRLLALAVHHGGRPLTREEAISLLFGLRSALAPRLQARAGVGRRAWTWARAPHSYASASTGSRAAARRAG